MEQSEALREATNNQFQIDTNNFVSTLNNYPRACRQKWQLVSPTQEDFNKFWNKVDIAPGCIERVEDAAWSFFVPV